MNLGKILCGYGIAICLCGCSPSRFIPYGEGEWVQKIPSAEFVQLLQDEVVRLRYQGALRLEDSKVYYDEAVQTVRLEFISQAVIDLKQARQLLVDLVESLLDRLNHHPSLESYLLYHPFTADHLEIYIDMQSYYGTMNDPYYVGWIKLEKGMSHFYAFDQKIEGKNEWLHRHEPYSKSLEIVQAEKIAEEKFKQTFEAEYGSRSCLKKEQYFPTPRCPLRYFSPDECRKELIESEYPKGYPPMLQREVEPSCSLHPSRSS